MPCRSITAAKVIGKISGKKYKRTNIVAGICGWKWVAPMEYNGTTDSKLFEYWFENCLLEEVKPGSVIVLDNLTFYKKLVIPALAMKKNCNVFFFHHIRLILTLLSKNGLGSRSDSEKSCRISILLIMHSNLFLKWFDYINKNG
jgi:hypothetical protein